MGWEGAFDAYPSLAIHILCVIQQWAFNDALLHQCLANFLSVDISVAMAMLDKIVNAELKKEVILGAAREAMDGSDFEIFDAALETTKSSRERRNQFAHWIWGTASNISDAIILFNPKLVSRMPNSLQGDTNQRQSGYVYDEKSLLDERERASKAAEVIMRLNMFTSHLYNGRGDDSIRTQLLGDHAIQNKIHSQSRKKSHSTGP